MFWGLVTSVFACGISVVQAHIYFHKNQDRLYLRTMAAIIFICELLSTTVMVAAVYQYLVPGFGNVANISVVSPTLSVECIFTIQITLIVQLFFAHQINGVRPPGPRGRTVMVILLAFAILSWLFGTVCYSMMFTHTNWEHRALGIEIGFTGARGFASLFDIVFTATMCFYLTEVQNEVMPRTQRLIRTLRILFLNRGLMVMIAQIALLVIDWAWHSQMYWFTPHLLVTRLYVNTFFAMLNSRKYLTAKYGLDRSEVIFRGDSSKTQSTAFRSVVLDDNSSRVFPEKDGPMVFVSRPREQVSVLSATSF